MRFVVLVPFVLLACANDVRPTQDLEANSSDPGVDGGLTTVGGTATTVADARVPPPDGIPQDLAPCDEAVYHSDFQFVQDKVFSVSCAVSGCHTGASPDAGMSLDAGRAWANLVDVPSSRRSGWTRVVPGNSPASLLMVEVGGEPIDPPLTDYMPWGQPRLCTELVDAMRRWIASGAPQS